MKQRFTPLFFVLLPIFILAFAFTALADKPAQANAREQAVEDVSRGAALYDEWFSVLGVNAPTGNMPLWSQQTTNTRSGPDTWRCVECHGWDYKGKDGDYASGTHETGFPGVYDAAQRLSQEDLVGVMKGSQNPEHDFSAYIDDPSLNQLALFLKTALINTEDFINPQTFDVIEGDRAHGEEFYNSVCAACHGEDGSQIVFRYEGANAYLGALAQRDPWRFLHKTRYGTPGTQMVVGHDIGWTAEDGRDVLLYAQGFPTGSEAGEPGVTIGEGGAEQPPLQGGPARNFWTGIATAIGALMAGIGFNLLIGAALVGIILVLVYTFRQGK